MKKQIITAVVITGLTLGSVSLAAAKWGGQNGAQFNSGQAAQTMVAPSASLDPEIQAKVNAFVKDNQQLHRTIFIKRAELAALMKAETPNVGKVGKTTGELYDLRAELGKKAEMAGVEQYISGRANGSRGAGVKGHPGQANMGKGGKRGGQAMNMTQVPVDPVIKEKVDDFIEKNQSLHQSMIVKRAEFGALMKAATPDVSKVVKNSGELYDLRADLREKAEAAGVAQYLPGVRNGQMGAIGSRGGHFRAAKGAKGGKRGGGQVMGMPGVF